MKRLPLPSLPALFTALVLGSGLAAGMAQAAPVLTSLGSKAAVTNDFTGDYAPANWTTTLTGALAGGGGPVDASNNGTTLTLTGGDDFCVLSGVDFLGPCTITYTLVAAVDTTFAFDWAYSTTDFGGPGFDPFGYTVDGAQTQLSPSGSGSESVSVLAGQTFGWYIDCGDCILGNSTATVSAFSATTAAAVPEPSSMALLGLSLAGLAAACRRRQA